MDNVRATTALWGCLGLYMFAACSSSAKVAPSQPPHTPESKSSAVTKIGDMPETEGQHELYFLSEQEGWLAGKNNLWRTADGGRTWTSIYSTGTDREEIKTFHFTGNKIGWVLTGNTLFKSTDSGKTWSRVNLPAGFAKGELREVTFLKDEKTGWVAGAVYEAAPRERLKTVPNNVISSTSEAVLRGVIFKTIDGGTTWEQQSVPAGVFRVLKVYVLDSQHGLALTDEGVLYTENGGRQWHAASFGTSCVNQNKAESSDGHPVSVTFANANIGWMSFSDGFVAKTVDAGRNWCDVLSVKHIWPANSYDSFLLNIYFVNEMRAWGLAADGTLLESKDAGATWTKVNTDIKFDNVYFLDANHGWAVSDEGVFTIAP